MAEQTEWTQLLVWLSISAFFRGAALSSFTLTVSEHFSLEQLPAAFGWHLIGKAIFVICFGPLIGKKSFLNYQRLKPIYFKKKSNFRRNS